MSYYNGRYSKALLDRVLDLWAKGMAFDRAYKQAGVSHTPAELHAKAFAWLVAGLPPLGVGDWALSTDLVVYLRKSGWGWGDIMVATNSTEGQVRACWADKTGVDSRGVRVGRGGRYYKGDADLYADTLRRTGTAVPVGTAHADRKVFALQQLYMAKSIGDLRTMADKAGLTYTPKSTKAQLVKALVKAQS